MTQPIKEVQTPNVLIFRLDLDSPAVPVPFGFLESTASCEGHLDHGEKAPWVDIGNIPSDELLGRADNTGDNPELEQIRGNNLREQERFLSLLDEFYQDRNVPAGKRLVIEPVGIYGAFRLTPQESDIQDIRTSEEQGENLAAYQLETQRFAEFLRRKHLES